MKAIKAHLSKLDFSPEDHELHYQLIRSVEMMELQMARKDLKPDPSKKNTPQISVRKDLFVTNTEDSDVNRTQDAGFSSRS